MPRAICQAFDTIAATPLRSLLCDAAPRTRQDGSEGPALSVWYPDGQKVEFHFGTGNMYTPMDGGIPDRVREHPGENFDLLLEDGGEVHFRTNAYVDAFGTTRYAAFPTVILDPYRQPTTRDYSPAGKLIRVTEQAGRYLQVNWTVSRSRSSMALRRTTT